MTKRSFTGIWMVCLALLMGCSAPSQAEITPSTKVAPPTPVGVVAEITVEPKHAVTLRVGISASITEVLVKEGDAVESGDILLRLDATDIENTIRQAEAELAAAQAGLALAQASTRKEQIAVLKAELEIAQAVVAQAEAQRDEQTAGLIKADVLAAQTEATLASVEHRQATHAHDETLKCHKYKLPDGSTEKICPALGPYEEMARRQMEAAHTAWEEAQARLATLQANAVLQAEAAQTAVESAIAQRNAVQARLDLAQAGSRPEEIAAVEANVRQAESALGRARTQLELVAIKAPFDGAVAHLPSRTGDIVALDEPLATVATLGRLQIKTVDLTEMDVPRVAVDQPAVVTLDAMPGQQLAGRVIRIDQQSVEHYDDVTYPVIIGLESAPPDWLRWGMRGQVEFAPGAVAEPSAGGSSKVIKADAIIEPRRWSTLQFVTDGWVENVLVMVGDQANEGDVLVQLRSADAALTVQEAEAALAAAQAQLALRRAGPRAQEIAIAEAALAEARAGLHQATTSRDQLANDAEAALVIARAQLETTNAERHLAQLASDQVDKRDSEKKRQAQERIHVADMQIVAAQARLAAQPAMSAAQLRGADAAVQEAEAGVRLAQAHLALLRAGHTVEEIALAETDVQQAEAHLAAAQTALARTKLYAPFAGVVTQVHVEPGDGVAPGQVVLVLAEPASFQVKTTNLTELDIVNVIVGESTVVTVDALPEETFDGVVREIALQPGDHYGDVVYTIAIDLVEKADPHLRWGMTAVVEIATE